MKNRFEKYLLFDKRDGVIIGVHPETFELADEAFELFKDLFDGNYGEIEEDDNLIAIHTGGWSENEKLIDEFKETSWWAKYHEITTRGGHFYFDTDPYSKNTGKWNWIITKYKKGLTDENN